MVKISIVMPVYNGEKFIQRSINSILDQTIDDIELICVNDESTDNTLKLLENLQKEHKFIKIINQKNSGSGKARNKGIANATGEYLAFLDADDIFVDDDSLEKMYEIAHEHDADMVGANLIRVSNDDELEDNFNYTNGNYKLFDGETVIEPMEYGIPWAFYKNIYKTSFIKENNILFPDLSRGQDPVFMAEVLTTINEIYTINRNLYGYYYNADGEANDKINTTTKKIDYLNHYKQTFDILDKNQFTSISNIYKNSFINFFKIKERNHDQEYLNLVYETFPNLEEYFDKDSYPYSYLSFIKENDEVNSDEFDDLIELKEEFITKLMINDCFIDNDEIRYFNDKINKIRYDKEFIRKSYTQIYSKHEKEQEEYNQIKDDIDQLTEEIKQLNSSNEEILSSNSWKYTKFLRDIKHVIK